VGLKTDLHAELSACPDVDVCSWLHPLHAPVCWHMALAHNSNCSWQVATDHYVRRALCGVGISYFQAAKLDLCDRRHEFISTESDMP